LRRICPGAAIGIGGVMTKARLATRLLAAVDRLTAALTDPQRRERTAIVVLVVYALLWTLYGAFAKASQDIHFDMAEMVAWSRELAFGYTKHPPLGAWMTAAWFNVFPVADWSFYLLSMTVATVALWLAWRLAGDYLDAEKRALVLPLLMFVPFFNFQALKFNANTVLLPMWAATTLCFLRSFERRSAGWAALAGLCAAGSMLGKYWSIFLLAGLGIAALKDSRRAAYFRSAAPWITVSVGALVLAPHAAWLVAHDFAPFAYAVSVHAGTHAVAKSVAGYLAGSAGYVALPVLLALLALVAMRPRRVTLADTLWPPGRERRLAAAAFWLPLLLPALAAPVAGIALSSLWSMSDWTLLPVVLLSSPRTAIWPGAARPIFGAAMVFPLAAVVAAPAVAMVIHRVGVAPGVAHTRYLAAFVATEWRKVTAAPIRLVGGDANLAYGVAFYLPDRPSSFPAFSRKATPWVDDTRIARQGIVLLCPAADQRCIAASAALAEGRPASRRFTVEFTRSYLGVAGKPARYSIVIVPPPP
jgi:4-amino-4-deoxy-L-arabinose transferase-like glycosyltransferase